jgi:hypothetical protein
MKLNGPHRAPQSQNVPKQESTSPSTRAENKASEEAPFDPLGSAFSQLAGLDRKASTGEPERIRTNLKGDFEALVDFKTDDGKSVVLAVRNEAEVPLYASLLSGGETDSPVGQLHQKLKSASDSKFYFQRGGEYLRTDAGGAAVALDRGSQVVLRRSDGQYEPHRDPETALRFVAGSDPKAAALRKELADAAESGMTVTVHSEQEGDEPPSKLQMVLQMFDRSSQLAMDRDLATAVMAGSRVDVGFENDERPIAIPLTLSREEMNLAAQWNDSPTEEIKGFKEEFKALSDDKTIFMTQQPSGQMKGMVIRADDRAAYFQLRQGERMVALDSAGDLHEMKSLKDFKTFKETGRVSPKTEAFDGSKTDSDNLMMFYHVSPFDPIGKGNYDDLPQRMTSVGSSPQLDIVTMRSDLPEKRNLRVDRVQQGELQEIKRLDADTAMSNPKVLEDFVYETVKSNMGDERIRFLVGGHGGAEKGLLPDGEHNNSAADQAMKVDKFAGAISKALDRVEKETGERPKIDNLMLVSCLMGNTSFIHALAQTGDIETLVASPELMAGSNPLTTFEYLADPKTSKATGREYAQHLVDTWSEAPAMVGGSKAQHHADTIGAYDLSPDKAKRFQKALGGFFEAALAEPQYAEYLKESVARAPSYGINPLINVMFDVDNRDLLQVLDHASTDARIDSKKLKSAMKELKEATEDQVIDQKVSEKYQGRRGPSLYLPLDKWDFNEKMSDTNLLKGTKYKEFMDMVFEAPLHRGVMATLINEASRLSETGVLDKAFEKLQDFATGAVDLEEPDGLEQETQRLEALHSLEEKTSEPTRSAKVLGLLKGTARAAAGIAGGAVGGAIVAGLGAVVGSVTGAVAGWRGVSAAGTHKPASKEEIDVLTTVVDELLEANGLANDKSDAGGEKKADGSTADAKMAEAVPVEDAKESPGEDIEDPDLAPLKGLLKGRVAKGLKQLILAPAEGTAIKVHESAGRKWGEFPGRILGALTGAVAGGLFTALTAGGVAFAGAGLFAAAQADNVLSALERPEIKGESTFTGRFGEDSAPQPE